MTTNRCTTTNDNCDQLRAIDKGGERRACARLCARVARKAVHEALRIRCRRHQLPRRRLRVCRSYLAHRSASRNRPVVRLFELRLVTLFVCCVVLFVRVT
jgi:hypothetical protein